MKLCGEKAREFMDQTRRDSKLFWWSTSERMPGWMYWKDKPDAEPVYVHEQEWRGWVFTRLTEAQIWQMSKQARGNL